MSCEDRAGEVKDAENTCCTHGGAPGCLLSLAQNDRHGGDPAGRQLSAPSAGSDSTEPAVAEIDTFAENPCITWFVRGIPGKVKSAEVYIGAEQVEVAEAGRLIDGEGLAPKTLILVDNSLSIGTKGNQEKIKSILTRLIWNHQYDERFALKTCPLYFCYIPFTSPPSLTAAYLRTKKHRVRT